MESNQDEILEKANALERLDYTLKVVGVRGWLVLLFFIGLVVLTLIWSVMGTIPITISGKCIAFAPESSIRVRSQSTGIVTDVKVKDGDWVRQGDLLVVLDNGQTIAAPVDGKIAWVDAVWGSTVTPEQVLLWIQKPYSPETLTILGFFPLASGQQIKVGMKAEIGLDQVDSSRYGMIQGIVQEVLNYPISSTDYYMQKIPSEPLREYLVSGPTPTIGVVVKPILDEGNPSGWKWTSRKGPPEPVKPGSIGQMRIILEEWEPIAFLFPSLKRTPQ